DPKRFVFPVSQTQAYKQIGNSVVVPAIETTAKEIIKILKDKKR
ncbi:DNA cytosine methyltransferase, partial [candidate division KSB1 bacterium]